MHIGIWSYMWYDVIWCDMMWYDVNWCIINCIMMWCDVIWCNRMVLVWAAGVALRHWQPTFGILWFYKSCSLLHSSGWYFIVDFGLTGLAMEGCSIDVHQWSTLNMTGFQSPAGVKDSSIWSFVSFCFSLGSCKQSPSPFKPRHTRAGRIHVTNECFLSILTHFVSKHFVFFGVFWCCIQSYPTSKSADSQPYPATVKRILPPFSTEAASATALRQLLWAWGCLPNGRIKAENIRQWDKNWSRI